MPSSTKLEPASGTSGFFQAHPTLSNGFAGDAALQRCWALFAAPATRAAVEPGLTTFAERVLTPEVFAWITDAERNPPYLRGNGFTALGNPAPNALVTSAGWRELQALGIRQGIVPTGYEPSTHGGADCRLVQMLQLHLWSASSAYVACPSAMQDGAVSVLLQELRRISTVAYSSYIKSDFLASQSRAVFTRALERLLSRDPEVAWTSGQWMTERAGGSDVAGTETIARWLGPSEASDGTDIDGLPLGPWRIDGFKWFSSATDCGVAILLAKTSKGLGCFFAPTRKRVKKEGRDSEEMNGLRIQRLKHKLGTRALPTAELELKAMRAWLVGEEGEGVRVISAMLTVTRVYNAATAMSHLGRGLSIVRAYAAVRSFPSQPGLTLSQLPLFARTTASTTLNYRSSMLLTFLVASLLGAVEHGSGLPPTTPTGSSLYSLTTDLSSCSPSHLMRLIPSDAEATVLLLRVFTPIAKARTAKAAIAGLQECMEALGGVGYCENEENQEMNVARLYRDANVLSIWEGTTDVMATDLVKVVKGREGAKVLQALDGWIEGVLGEGSGEFLGREKALVREAWRILKLEVDRTARDELLASGREVMAKLGDVVCGLLLLADGMSDGDNVAAECAARSVDEWFGGRREGSEEGRRRLDASIAFGLKGRPGEKL